MTNTQRRSCQRPIRGFLAYILCAVFCCVWVVTCPRRVDAQPAPGFPPPRPDFRDDWMKESDWIWRSSRKHNYPHHATNPYPHWPVPFYSSGYGAFYPYSYPMPYGLQDPHNPSLYDPAYRTGQPTAPPATEPTVDDPPAGSPSLAPSPDDGRVDPGSRRYVSRWQKSGRGYLHVHGWEWTSNGVVKQRLNSEFVDRSEMADPVMLEAVPARKVPTEPEDGSQNTARHESGNSTNSLFDSLDANGDGQISAEEFRTGLTKPRDN